MCGKLRQINHRSDTTIVELMQGNGSLAEFVLAHSQIVIVMPVELSIEVDKDEQP